MISRLRKEAQDFTRVWKGLDQQVVWIFILASFLVILQFAFGSRRFFRREISQYFTAGNLDLLAWGWWFAFQFICGFVIPVLVSLFVLKRSAKSMGLGLGDWRFAVKIMLLYLPLVIIGAWILTGSADFRQVYPHLQRAAFSWEVFLIYELLFLLYWIGWEYTWRGFILFGTKPRLGIYAIFVQALPFAVLHFNKPFPEAVLSIFGGIALGFLVWRCRSFWIAVPIHALQGLIVDFTSSLRIRSGVHGVKLGDLVELIRNFF